MYFSKYWFVINILRYYVKINVYPRLWMCWLNCYYFFYISNLTYCMLSFFIQTGCLYVYGVVVCIDHVMTSDVYKIWLKIPSLKDLCWNKVISSMSQLASMERERMQELGIPLEYMDRLKAWNIQEKIHKLVQARINLQARTSQACAEPDNFVPVLLRPSSRLARPCEFFGACTGPEYVLCTKTEGPLLG